MREPFLLLDPGILVPPSAAASASDHRKYWLRLIEWAADRRLRLGRRGQHAVVEVLGSNWPDPTPPGCPHGLRREATQALSLLLASVVAPPDAKTTTGSVVTTDPRYVKDPLIDTAIKSDVAEQHNLGLLGAATAHAHWSEPAETARLRPGPPQDLTFVTVPGVVSAAERDLRVAKRLATYRLTIVGGLAKESVYKQLKTTFGVEEADVRWIETERSQEAPLDQLRGMRPGSDIVFCVTGWISHAESQKVVRLSRKCGVTCIVVEKRSEVVEQLRAHFDD